MLPPRVDVRAEGVVVNAVEPYISDKRVREEITNEETGTTFLLADDGLYLVRRPSVERDKESRELAARDAG